MKQLLILPGLFLVAACGIEGGGADSDTDNALPTSESTTATKPSSSDMAPVEAAKLPWDIPIMPNARYISGSPKFSKTTKKRGGEAIATIAVEGSVADIVSYYEKVLPELGFEITHNRVYDESTGSVHGENADGAQFRVAAMRGGSNARTGESTAGLLAIMPKLPE
ncbi:MAG: hypothetical protein ABJN65_12065 [Parasphingorhabdus sp.]